MNASLVFETKGVQGNEYAQTSVQIAHIPLHWPCLRLRLWSSSRLIGSTVGYEDKDIGGGYKGCYAEEADELG